MKILYLNYSSDTLQIMRIEDVAHGLRLQGHEVIVKYMHHRVSAQIKEAQKRDENPYTTSRKVSLIFRPRQRWLAVAHGEFRRFVGNLRFLFIEIAEILKHKPDFVLTRLMPIWSIFLSAFLLRQKLVLDTDGPMLEAFGYEGSNLPYYYLRLEKIFIRKAKALSVISSSMKEFYGSFGGDPDRIFVCPNGINAQLFHPHLDATAIKDKYHLKDKVVIGFMGNLASWHGLPGLLNEFPALAHKYENVHLLLVGFQLDWDNLPEEVDKKLADFKNRITCTGRIPFESMPYHLKAIDIFVLPYRFMEFFYFSPVKLFESMGVGCVVAAAGIGQIAEVIEDGKDGLLFPAGNYDEMRLRIEKLIEDPSLRLSLGKAAAEKIHANYLWEITTKAMIKAYQYAYGHKS